MSVVLFHPSVKGGYKTAVDGSLVAAVRNFVGIKETFVTATNDAALAEKTFLDLGFLKTAAEAAATTKAAADAAAKRATAATLPWRRGPTEWLQCRSRKRSSSHRTAGRRGWRRGRRRRRRRRRHRPQRRRASAAGDGARRTTTTAPAALKLRQSAGETVEAAEAAATEAARSRSAATRAAILSLWPAVSRFSSGRRRGANPSGIMRRLAVLAADEGDAFMWDGFLETFTAAAQQLRGEAFFLYADDDELRIAPLLRTAGVGHEAAPS